MTAYVPGLDDKNLTNFARSLRELASGRSNAVRTFTLNLSAGTTTVQDDNCAEGSTVIPIPITANAATELGNGTMYLFATANKSFTFAHANSATANRTFRYAILG